MTFLNILIFASPAWAGPVPFSSVSDGRADGDLSPLEKRHHGLAMTWLTEWRMVASFSLDTGFSNMVQGSIFGARCAITASPDSVNRGKGVLALWIPGRRILRESQPFGNEGNIHAL